MRGRAHGALAQARLRDAGAGQHDPNPFQGRRRRIGARRVNYGAAVFFASGVAATGTVFFSALNGRTGRMFLCMPFPGLLR